MSKLVSSASMAKPDKQKNDPSAGRAQPDPLHRWVNVFSGHTDRMMRWTHCLCCTEVITAFDSKTRAPLCWICDINKAPPYYCRFDHDHDVPRCGVPAEFLPQDWEHWRDGAQARSHARFHDCLR